MPREFEVMSPFIVPLSAPEAADAERFGPKAANQAALGHAGLPIPDGFCLDAAAYVLQLAESGLQEAATGAAAADRPDAYDPGERAADLGEVLRA